MAGPYSLILPTSILLRLVSGRQYTIRWLADSDADELADGVIYGVSLAWSIRLCPSYCHLYHVGLHIAVRD